MPPSKAFRVLVVRSVTMKRNPGLKCQAPSCMDVISGHLPKYYPMYQRSMVRSSIRVRSSQKQDGKYRVLIKLNTKQVHQPLFSLQIRQTCIIRQLKDKLKFHSLIHKKCSISMLHAEMEVKGTILQRNTLTIREIRLVTLIHTV